MAEYNNNNRMAIFAVKEKKNDKSPDYTGSVTIANIDFDVALWKTVSKGGLTYLSGQVNKKEDQPVASSAPVANTVEDLEDIPF
ncbi:hypothetical protein N9J50_01955 [Methylophilaceae bacterium]|nr:hypothetical protein [Methylophilaceae bacterium]